MKQTILAIAMMVCCITTFGRSAMDRWPALKSFHEVMAATFHPSEEGKLEPIKKQIDEFVNRAAELKTAPRPSEYDNAKVNTVITKLNVGAKELKVLIVKKAPDAQIRTKLSTLHDLFKRPHPIYFSFFKIVSLQWQFHKCICLCKVSKISRSIPFNSTCQ